jgi:hypothetical protein
MTPPPTAHRPPPRRDAHSDSLDTISQVYGQYMDEMAEIMFAVSVPAGGAVTFVLPCLFCVGDG